jgi:hypothetical protein
MIPVAEAKCVTVEGTRTPLPDLGKLDLADLPQGKALCRVGFALTIPRPAFRIPANN